MKSADLLNQAEYLCRRARKRPKQADLRRAVSAAYYGVFHDLCATCANAFIGASFEARSSKAWRQVYRALNHNDAKRRSKTAQSLGFPREIRDFARAFVNLQQQRHSADYDPAYRLQKSEALRLIGSAKIAIEQLKSANMADRRAFAAFVLLQDRK